MSPTGEGPILPAVSPEALYIQLGRLVQSMPDLTRVPSQEVQRWLAQVYALVSASGESADAFDLKQRTAALGLAPHAEYNARMITDILFRSLAVAELRAPARAQGSFIPAGNAMDAFTALSKVLGEATRDVLIVDPYLDAKVLTDFAPLAPERVALRLLADAHGHRPTLKPASQSWIAQYGADRPLDVRLALRRTLHDRVIIVDGSQVRVLTQSLNAFAARSPASIVKVDDETAALKVAAYEDMWAAAAPL